MSTILASGSNASSDGNTVTATINTANADLIVLAQADYGSEPASTISETGGFGGLPNTWTALGNYVMANRIRLSWATPASNQRGNNHGFVLTKTVNPTYPAVAVVAISGIVASPYDSERVDYQASGMSLQHTSFTPGVSDAIIIAAMQLDGGTAHTLVGDGFTQLEYNDGVVSFAFGIALWYKFQVGSPAAVAPQWTWLTTNVPAAATLAAFKGTAGAADATVPQRQPAFDLATRSGMMVGLVYKQAEAKLKRRRSGLWVPAYA